MNINGDLANIQKYPAKQHAHAVLKHLKADNGLICLPGSGLPTWEDSDMPKPFRQFRYFYYLSGCNEPNCYLTYDISLNFSTLYIAPIVPTRVVWSGRGSNLDEAKALYDVDDVKYTTSLLKDYGSWARTNPESTIYFLHSTADSFVPRTASFTAPYSKSSEPTIDTCSLLPAINAARTIKFPHEIDLIRQANSISTKAHRAVLRSVHHYTNERQISAKFTQISMANGAPHQSYDIIAGSGPNAAILHYMKNDEPLKGRQLVCLDAGAEYMNYASDITRTFPISGYFSKEAKAIYDLVQKMQDACIERIKPGVRFLDLFRLAGRIALTGLISLGILHGGSEEEIYLSDVISIFFPHGLGHHLGLEVHDVSVKPILSSASASNNNTNNTNNNNNTTLSYQQHQQQHLPSLPTTESGPQGSASTTCQPAPTTSSNQVSNEQSPNLCSSSAALLEPNMVITVEPGIYFSRYAIDYYTSISDSRIKYIDQDILERYFPVGGIRIEDDILITETGYENITTAPKGEEMLNLIREGWRDRRRGGGTGRDPGECDDECTDRTASSGFSGSYSTLGSSSPSDVCNTDTDTDTDTALDYQSKRC